MLTLCRLTTLLGLLTFEPVALTYTAHAPNQAGPRTTTQAWPRGGSRLLPLEEQEQGDVTTLYDYPAEHAHLPRFPPGNLIRRFDEGKTPTAAVGTTPATLLRDPKERLLAARSGPLETSTY